MQRHSLDPKTFDYTWKQNRLSKDKEALKNSVLNVIRKKPAVEKEKSPGITGGQTPMIQQTPMVAQGYGSPGQDQGQTWGAKNDYS
jgi:hypothetical protein